MIIKAGVSAIVLSTSLFSLGEPVSSAQPCPPPPPRSDTPAPFAGVEREGVNLGAAWNSMLDWTRDQAWLVLDQSVALTRTNLATLPKNVWNKSVVISFSDAELVDRPLRFGQYEVSNCRPRSPARRQLGSANCNWDLRVIEAVDFGWFSDYGGSSAAWVSDNLKPEALIAQARTARAAGKTPFVADWAAFGDPKPQVKAGAIKVKVYNSATCPQVARGLVKLGAIAQSRNPARLLDGPYPPLPPDGNSIRKAALYLGASGRGVDLTLQGLYTEASLLNQIHTEIRKVETDCRSLGQDASLP